MKLIRDILVQNYDEFSVNCQSINRKEKRREEKKLYFVSDENLCEVPFVRVCTKRNLESDEMSDFPVYESVQIPDCWNNEEVP